MPKNHRTQPSQVSVQDRNANLSHSLLQLLWGRSIPSYRQHPIVALKVAIGREYLPLPLMSHGTDQEIDG